MTATWRAIGMHDFPPGSFERAAAGSGIAGIRELLRSRRQDRALLSDAVVRRLLDASPSTPADALLDGAAAHTAWQMKLIGWPPDYVELAARMTIGLECAYRSMQPGLLHTGDVTDKREVCASAALTALASIQIELAHGPLFGLLLQDPRCRLTDREVWTIAHELHARIETLRTAHRLQSRRGLKDGLRSIDATYRTRCSRPDCWPNGTGIASSIWEATAIGNSWRKVMISDRRPLPSVRVVLEAIEAAMTVADPDAASRLSRWADRFLRLASASVLEVTMVWDRELDHDSYEEIARALRGLRYEQPARWHEFEADERLVRHVLADAREGITRVRPTEHMRIDVAVAIAKALRQVTGRTPEFRVANGRPVANASGFALVRRVGHLYDVTIMSGSNTRALAAIRSALVR